MAPGAVDRDPDNRCAIALKLWEHLAVEGHLVAADRAPVGRVERNDQRPAAEVCERRRLVWRRVKCEVRCLCAFRERARRLCSGTRATFGLVEHLPSPFGPPNLATALHLP